jgi:hypothetical protein
LLSLVPVLKDNACWGTLPSFKSVSGDQSTLYTCFCNKDVGRSDTHEGQTFEEPHTYVMKRQSNATSKSQAS